MWQGTGGKTPSPRPFPGGKGDDLRSQLLAKQVGCNPTSITRTAARDAEVADQLAEAQANADLKSLRLIDRATDQEANLWPVSSLTHNSGDSPGESETGLTPREIGAGCHRWTTNGSVAAMDD